MKACFDLHSIATSGARGFGSAVAISGDTIVVGSLFQTGSDSGVVHVFVRDGKDWKQQACLKSGLRKPAPQFGYAVAICGDTIAFGMPMVAYNRAAGDPKLKRRESIMRSGAVLIFVREQGTWRRQAFLRSGKIWMQDSFGHAIALSGDTLFVGAWGDGGDREGNYPLGQASPWQNSGAVYAFTRNAGVWTLQQYIKPSTMGWGYWFGSSVSLDGDRAVVGASCEYHLVSVPRDEYYPEPRRTQIFNGAAYVFTRQGGKWSEQCRLSGTRSRIGDGENFGQEVAIRGETVVVSTPNRSYDRLTKPQPGEGPERIFADYTGAMYVFQLVGQTWRRQRIIRPNKVTKFNQLGAQIALGEGLLVTGMKSTDTALVYPLPMRDAVKT